MEKSNTELANKWRKKKKKSTDVVKTIQRVQETFKAQKFQLFSEIFIWFSSKTIIGWVIKTAFYVSRTHFNEYI